MQFSRPIGTSGRCARGGSSGMRSQHLRSALVIGEVALAVVLLAGAGLMIRSIQKLAAINPGFDAANVLMVNATIPRQPTPPAAAAAPGGPPAPPAPFVRSHVELLDRIRAVPGVESVSLASDLPFGGSSATFYSAEGDTTVAAETMPRAYIHRVTPEFFATLRINVCIALPSADAAIAAYRPAGTSSNRRTTARAKSSTRR